MEKIVAVRVVTGKLSKRRGLLVASRTERSAGMWFLKTSQVSRKSNVDRLT